MYQLSYNIQQLLYVATDSNEVAISQQIIQSIANFKTEINTLPNYVLSSQEKEVLISLADALIINLTVTLQEVQVHFLGKLLRAVARVIVYTIMGVGIGATIGLSFGPQGTLPGAIIGGIAGLSYALCTTFSPQTCEDYYGI